MLRWILRFEAAAANELYENTKNDIGFEVPKIYWNQTSKKVLMLRQNKWYFQ